MKLNDAEAWAAALYIVGLPQLAHQLLESFPYGPEFFKINAHLLDAYAACANAAEVIAVQNTYIQKCEAEKKAKREGKSDDDPYAGLPSYSDDEEEDCEETTTADCHSYSEPVTTETTTLSTTEPIASPPHPPTSLPSSQLQESIASSSPTPHLQTEAVTTTTLVLSAKNIRRMKPNEMKKILKNTFGLSTQGNKKELMDRLLAANTKLLDSQETGGSLSHCQGIE